MGADETRGAFQGVGGDLTAGDARLGETGVGEVGDEPRGVVQEQAGDLTGVVQAERVGEFGEFGGGRWKACGHGRSKATRGGVAR